MSQLDDHKRARYLKKVMARASGGVRGPSVTRHRGGCAGAGRTVYRGLAPDIMTCERRDDNSERQDSLRFLAISLHTPDSAC